MTEIIERFKRAVYHDDASGLRQFLADHPEMKARVDEPLFHFDAPAIVIAARGSRDMIDALLEAGANINARSTWWAGGFGVLDMDCTDNVPYLIERGAIVDAYSAARHGMMDRLRRLVEESPESAGKPAGDGQTPLHVASSVEVAEFLLEHGAEIDKLDIDHESTPAQYLVRSHPEVVRFLISRGCRTDILMAAAVGDAALVRRHLDADPECIRTRVNAQYFPMRNPHAGGTIYIWTIGKNRSVHQTAKRFGHEELLPLLMERTPEEIRLAEACLIGDASFVNEARRKNPDGVREVAQTNPGAISDAAEDNNTDAVQLMAECGWPLEGDGQHTPLHWACWHGNAEMVRAILPFHPPLEFADAEYKAPPLGWALHGSENGWHRATGNYGETVKLLLAAGAQRPPRIEGSPAVREALQS